ncbi:MAG: phosphatidylserine decarboxylase [Polyangiaceae bacterium]|nr:phosphatidylserine decarboxylase [Polyangiaceae bacterium]
MGVATYAAAQVLRALPRKRLSRAVGQLCDRPLSDGVSRAVAETYSRVLGVDVGEAEELGRPYRSFDEFFTRRLRAGLRPIADAPVVSPADGRVASRGRVEPSGMIVAKGRPYDVGELLGDPSTASRWWGGAFAVVYLSPRDYHRVHSPVDGAVELVRGIPGDLFPVNAIGERHVPGLFVKNNRVVLLIDSPSVGRAAVVLVGATIVGRISVARIPAPAVPPGDHAPGTPWEVARGDELGAFHLGSTAVVLLERGFEIVAPTGAIRYGQALARRR